VSVFDAPAPLVFAHRGGCALGPENTLAAFDLGMAAGADGLELDVHLSEDGVVVVHHDETLDRTTSESGPIASRTAAELERIDAACRFASPPGSPPGWTGGVPRGPGGHVTGIPRLRDVLARYASVPIIIEMKVDSAAMGEAVARDVREANAVDRVCAAGFGRRSLAAARRALPRMATSAARREVQLALYGSWVRWPIPRGRYAAFQVPEQVGRLRVVSRALIRRAHAAGVMVHVWTVDEQGDMERLLAWGVDALITNRPDLAVRVRDGFVAVHGPR
jgi:glycerophosphoryl diester phosphodiesterase